MQNARPLKSKVSITLDDEVIQQIRSWSIEEDNSFSRYINRVLKQHIEQKRKSQKKIKHRGQYPVFYFLTLELRRGVCLFVDAVSIRYTVISNPSAHAAGALYLSNLLQK